jgi:hypothetical protein
MIERIDRSRSPECAVQDRDGGALLLSTLLGRFPYL